MVQAVLSLGSNLGDRGAHLAAAVIELRPWLLTVSEVYETRPWGDPAQPNYLNAIALVADDVDVMVWLARAHRLEAAAGRVRDRVHRFGPRTLDVDVIAAYTDDGAPIVRRDRRLTLPHPRAHLRAFVLRPWLDVQPLAQLPGRGYVRHLLDDTALAADLAAMVKREDLRLPKASG